MNTEGVLTATPLQLTQENDLVIYLLDRHIVILDAPETFLHLVQFMVVRGKERARFRFRMLMDVLHDCPGDGNTVIRGSAASQLVEQYQATRRKVVQDVCRLVHLYHKGRLAHGNIIAGPHTGEYLIHQPDMGILRRYETADLSQQRNQCRLPQQSGLTRHIGTCYDNNLLGLAIQHHIVGNILLADGKLFLNHRMPSLADFQHIVVGNDGTYIVVLACCRGKGEQAVQTRYLVRIDLNGRNELAQRLHQLCIELCFQHQYLVLRAENLLFVLLQFLGNVAFGIGKGLLAYPLCRHFVFMRVAHLDVVAKDIIVAYLQAGNFRQLALALLYLQQIILTGVSNPAQLVQFGTDTGLDDTSFINQQRRVIVYLPVDAVADGLADVQLFAYMIQTGIVGLHTSRLDGFNGLQSHLQRHHLTRRDTAYRHFGDDTFQVAYQMQLFLYQFLEIGLAEEVFHHIQPLVNRLHVFQREYQPTFQQAGTHRADGLVYHVQQTAAAIVHAAHQLQAAHCELIQADILILLDACQRSNMPNLRMLRHDEVLQDGSRSYDAVLEMLYTEAFQVLHLEMLQQLLPGRGLGKHPVVQLESEELAAEVSLEHQALATLEKHFFRSKIVQQLVHIVERSLSRQKFARRYIQKSHPASSFAEMDGSQEVVFPVVQHIVVDGYSRRHQFRDATLHQLLRQLRVFQLVANSHTLTGTYQFRQISIERMMWETSHLDGLPLAVGTFGQGNTENFGRNDSIGGIGFIEVTTTKQHDSIGMLCLQVKELFHHRGKDNIFVHTGL